MSESMMGKLCLSCFRLKGEYQICPHCGYVEGESPAHLFCLKPGGILCGCVSIEEGLCAQALREGGFSAA